MLTHIMLCEHKQGTKLKLVSQAWWYLRSGEYHLEFIYKPCCVLCGRVVE